jgi:hypothetical protein
VIWITGDTHGDFRRFATGSFPQQKRMSRDDYVIITGDYGGIWDGSPRETYWLNWLEEKPFTSSEEIPLCSVPACSEDFTRSIPFSSPHATRCAGLARGPSLWTETMRISTGSTSSPSITGMAEMFTSSALM